MGANVQRGGDGDQIFLLKPSTWLGIFLDLHFSFAALFPPLELSKLNKRHALRSPMGYRCFE